MTGTSKIQHALQNRMKFMEKKKKQKEKKSVPVNLFHDFSHQRPKVLRDIAYTHKKLQMVYNLEAGQHVISQHGQD